MRPVRVTLFLAVLALAGSLAPAKQSVRLESSADRVAFRRWFTFMAESRYYARKPLREVSDGESLIRWAIRHALGPHDLAWSRHVELPVFPVMPSVAARSTAAESGAPFLVSRDLEDAEPGDILLYSNTDLPAHVMVYIGRSQVVHTVDEWVIYLAGGVVHKVKVDRLCSDPSPDWRPVSENPAFLGVWRLDLLSAE